MAWTWRYELEPAGSGGRSTEPAGSGGRSTEPAGSGGRSTEPAGSGGRSTEPAGSGGRGSEPAGSGGRGSEPSGGLEDWRHGGVSEPFASQSDAESWLGQTWRDLAAAGVVTAVLLEDDRVEYRMSLQAGK